MALAKSLVSEQIINSAKANLIFPFNPWLKPGAIQLAFLI
jgi:hypothetical protein